MQHTYKDYIITIEYDDNVHESPLDWDTPEERGVYYALDHNRYNLPYELDTRMSGFDSWRELAEAVTGDGGELEGYIYKFVNWYEHSGVSVSLVDDDTRRGWDSGIAGVVFGETYDAIVNQFATYKQYAEGDIYTYVIEDSHGDTIDALSGIYGDDAALEEAESFIDSYKPPRGSVYAVKAGALHV